MTYGRKTGESYGALKKTASQQLFIAQMIEKSGTKCRRPNEIKKGTSTRMRAGIETIDEVTGDWTLETARQKLHEFLAKRKIALEYLMDEKGMASHRTYIAKLEFELDGKKYSGLVNKKMTFLAIFFGKQRRF